MTDLEKLLEIIPMMVIHDGENCRLDWCKVVPDEEGRGWLVGYRPYTAPIGIVSEGWVIAMRGLTLMQALINLIGWTVQARKGEEVERKDGETNKEVLRIVGSSGQREAEETPVDELTVDGEKQTPPVSEEGGEEGKGDNKRQTGDRPIFKQVDEGKKINLCNSCQFDIPDCTATEQVFGDGPGNDNIIECPTYRFDSTGRRYLKDEVEKKRIFDEVEKDLKGE